MDSFSFSCNWTAHNAHTSLSFASYHLTSLSLSQRLFLSTPPHPLIINNNQPLSATSHSTPASLNVSLFPQPQNPHATTACLSLRPSSVNSPSTQNRHSHRRTHHLKPSDEHRLHLLPSLPPTSPNITGIVLTATFTIEIGDHRYPTRQQHHPPCNTP